MRAPTTGPTGEIAAPSLQAIEAWLVQAGLRGEPDHRVVSGFCERAVSAGLPVSRAQAVLDTLHPVYEGRVFRWGHNNGEPAIQDYGRTQLPEGVSGLDPSRRLSRRPRRSRDGAQVLIFICCKRARAFCDAASRRKANPSFRSFRSYGPQA